jgi:hypothetical protein
VVLPAKVLYLCLQTHILMLFPAIHLLGPPDDFVLRAAEYNVLPPLRILILHPLRVDHQVNCPASLINCKLP